MAEIKDSEVIQIMIDGGERLCDHALDQWYGDKYKQGEEARQENIRRWNQIRKRIREIANKWKSK